MTPGRSRRRPPATGTIQDFPQATAAVALVPASLLHQVELITATTTKHLHESNVRLTITIGCGRSRLFSLAARTGHLISLGASHRMPNAVYN